MTPIEKPWGKEEILEINNNYMVKKLTMWKGKRCSLQYHTKKCETIYVLNGALKIYYGSDQKSLFSKIFTINEHITLAPGIIHRMEAVQDSIYIEASTPEINDVIRLMDDYNRVNHEL